MGELKRLADTWFRCLPTVTPFYAVKCLSDERLVRAMKDMGFGFDCASRKEIALAKACGADSDRIVFAHPCKRPDDIAFAASHDVTLMTVDNAREVDKIVQHFHIRLDPKTTQEQNDETNKPKLLLRLKVNAEHSAGHLIPMGLKYGATLREVPDIVDRIKLAGLNLVGVSFHVGSGCSNPAAFQTAIRDARHAFRVGRDAGFDMSILDIGGGFRSVPAFEDIARHINRSLDEHGFSSDGTTVIAEPGRFFAEEVVTLVTPIIGACTRADEDSNSNSSSNSGSKDTITHYYISDGIYGSFNCILYENQRLSPLSLRQHSLDSQDSQDSQDTTASSSSFKKSIVWGPTCDSTDCVSMHCDLPELDVGDMLVFEKAGAYTLSGACDFNGIEFTSPVKVYVNS